LSELPCVSSPPLIAGAMAELDAAGIDWAESDDAGFSDYRIG